MSRRKMEKFYLNSGTAYDATGRSLDRADCDALIDEGKAVRSGWGDDGSVEYTRGFASLNDVLNTQETLVRLRNLATFTGKTRMVCYYDRRLRRIAQTVNYLKAAAPATQSRTEVNRLFAALEAAAQTPAVKAAQTAAKRVYERTGDVAKVRNIVENLTLAKGVIA